MSDNSVNESIIIKDDDDEDIKGENTNSFQFAVKELGNILFDKYPEKTSNLSSENINGIVRIEVLNEYMSVNFGYRYQTLDKLVKQKQLRVISHDGFGVEKIIEFVKSIQASFEQTQIPDRLQGLIRR
jgi:hypothetical protein